MAWNREGGDFVEATAYTRDYSADSVFQELKETGGSDFTSEPEYINHYLSGSWKVYKITIKIEPAEPLD